jgi:hypothetical protein
MRYHQFTEEENRKDGKYGLGHLQGYYSNHVDYCQNTIYPPDVSQWDIKIASRNNGQPQGSLYLGFLYLKRGPQKRIA